MKDQVFIPIFEVAEPNVEGKTPMEFVPVMETKSKKRLMEWPLDETTTIEALEFLIQDGQAPNFKVMMTNKCNLSCTYCFQQHNEEMILWTDEILDFTFQALLKVDASHCWNTTKTWDWFGGEPLIYKKKIIEFMRRNKDDIMATTDVDYALTTNATLITEDFVEEFTTYNGAYIVVSLDTVFLDNDNRNHDSKSMKQVLTAIGLIAKHAGPYKTSVTMTVSPQQAPTIFAALEVMYQVGARNFLVNPLIYNKTEMADWSIESLQKLRDDILVFADVHKDVILEFGAEVADKKTTNCLTGGKNFGIDGSGDVTGCFFFSNDKKKHSDIVLANVFSGLTNPNYAELAKQDGQFYEEDPKCRTCDLWNMCYVCPAGVYDTTDGTRYFQSNGSCQEVVRCHVVVRDQIAAVNQPFREKRIAKFEAKMDLEKSGISLDDVVWDKEYSIAAIVHPNPESVLILGGGLGGLIREANNAGATDITAVEVDQRIVELTSALLPEINEGGKVFDKCSLVIDDGYDYIRHVDNRYDLIINDIEDQHPEGGQPEDFIPTVSSLLNKDGIYVEPGNTDMIEDQGELSGKLNQLSTHFKFVGVVYAELPTIGPYPFLWASHSEKSKCL